MVILNTGGTFNKRYDPISGELFVPADNGAIEAICRVLAISIDIRGIIHKDSLEMDEADRALLCDTIRQSAQERIVVVHGTDTMGLSAAAVAAAGLDKTVVFTGAMVPFSIDPIEATANLAMAMGYAQSVSGGVSIVMQGVMGPYDRVKKNRKLGKFEYV
ncbi:MAG: asparaginase [Sulfuricurvum sp.]|jgi:L-asparaginase|uniref:asparaginase domain-containing protein n=1 Tax=Sulfuricurvum sp. TaxID=2025608 RepID=UPI0025D3F4D5|nr:asparaginase domain-containing protein [Sulfuricurvum sp.]MCK9373385.1 asparaginase [Sulfuricurvum sp.]